MRAVRPLTRLTSHCPDGWSARPTVIYLLSLVMPIRAPDVCAVHRISVRMSLQIRNAKLRHHRFGFALDRPVVFLCGMSPHHCLQHGICRFKFRCLWQILYCIMICQYHVSRIWFLYACNDLQKGGFACAVNSDDSGFSPSCKKKDALSKSLRSPYAFVISSTVTMFILNAPIIYPDLDAIAILRRHASARFITQWY